VSRYPSWEEIPKDFNPNATPEEAQAYADNFDDQIRSHGGTPPINKYDLEDDE
jgi:hypothetical protein